MRLVQALSFVALVSFLHYAVPLTAAPAQFPLTFGERTLPIWVEPQAGEPVRRAASDLADDISRVTGLPQNKPVEAPPTTPCILVGQLGAGGMIDRLVAERKLEVTAIRGKWEASVRAVVDRPFPGVDRALVIAGSDARGTIYALYDISEEIGVSPWHWWADVPVRENRAPAISDETRVSSGPSVQYRGISIDTSQWGLRPWAAKTFEPEAGGIGPKTHARIFELLLRLRANTFWPATGDDSPPFSANHENPIVAERYGIVISGSQQAPKIFRPDDKTSARIGPDLRADDDATILIPDDNYGYVRQFPPPNERERTAGFGVHYHLSHAGPPLSYLWLNTTPPALIWSEMSKAYELGARKLWIVEVGDIKPAEIGMDFFLRLAFDAKRWNPNNLPEILKDWSTRTFGPDHAEPIAKILAEFYRHNFQRKPEHLQWSSPDGKRVRSPFTHEERLERLDAFARLRSDAQKIPLSLTPAADAYFQLVLYPVIASAAANERFFCAEEYLARKDSAPEEAGQWAARAQNAHRTVLAETVHYNEKTAGGKWRHLLAHESTGNQGYSVHIAPPYIPEGEFAFVPPPEPEDLFAKTKLARPPSSFRERAGVIAIDAQNFSGSSATRHGTWEIIRGVGRTGAVVAPFPRTLTSPSIREIVRTSPRLDYVIQTESAGDYWLILETLPAHPLSPDRPIALGVALDDNLPAMMTLSPHHGTPLWAQGVLDAVRTPQTKLTIPTAGRHVLRVFGVDPAVALDKLYLVAPQATFPVSYLGPKETPAPPAPRLTLDEIERRNAQLFSPLQGEEAAIAPDGRHIAYSVRSGDEVSVVVRPFPLSDTINVRIAVASDKTAVPSAMFHTQQAAIRWMRWVTSDQLVFQDNSQVIVAVEASGKNVRRLQRRGKFESGWSFSDKRGAHTVPVNSAEAVVPDDPLKIIIQADRITYRSSRYAEEKPEQHHNFHLHDIVENRTSGISEKNAEALIERDSKIQNSFRATWPEASQELQENLPGKKIEILAGDPTGRFIIFTAQNLADPGVLALYDREKATITEIIHRSTNGGTVSPHTSSSIDILEPDGLRLTATLTLPYSARSKAAPLIVICPSKPSERALQIYRPEFQALADAGFAVAQIEGYAVAHGKTDDKDAPKQLDHLFRIIDRLTERFPVNPRRIALIGEAHGTQLALRAMQARPQQFRCVVFVDPWTGIQNWELAAETRSRTDRSLKRPALLFWKDYVAGNSRYPGSLRRNGLTVTTKSIGKMYDRQSMAEVRRAYTLIENFLNEHLYDYEVSTGPEKYLD